jgi:hypothetical protein
MEQKIKLKYINSHLQIGMASWREVYYLSPELIQLKPEFYKGKLVYRKKESDRRITYAQIKQGLKKK